MDDGMDNDEQQQQYLNHDDDKIKRLDAIQHRFLAMHENEDMRRRDKQKVGTTAADHNIPIRKEKMKAKDDTMIGEARAQNRNLTNKQIH